MATLPARGVDDVVRQVQAVGFAVDRRYHLYRRVFFVAGDHIQCVQVTVAGECVDKPLRCPCRRCHGGCGQGIVANKAFPLPGLLGLV